jgi:hypothetical protein
MSMLGIEDVTQPGRWFRRKTTKTLFGELPQELADRIFDFGSGRRSLGFSNYRLVAQQWHAKSSPRLVTTAVIAARPKTLNKIQQLMNHPYFNKHVTHLIWDASEYYATIVEVGSMYSEIFIGSEHLETYTVSRGGEDLSNMDRRVAKIEDQSTVGGSAAMRWNVLQQSGRNIFPPIDKSIVTDLLPSNKFDINKNSVYMVGCSQGKKRYATHLKAQQIIQAKELTHVWFREALESFPSLQHMTVSDFRTLAYPEETYIALCRRLFGDVICPEFAECHIPEQFFDIYRSPLRGGWRSFSMGHHPFLINTFDRAAAAHK